MDYLYENLGDERFQEFCSSLISKEFPNIQAYPVGQADGGRDTIVYLMNSDEKEFIVFQVKFVRNANQERDVHKWLIETIEKETEKINKLIPKGAKEYYLLTNVRGTAHLDSGSKDKVNKILEERIKIPSMCWWRDDLSRMFEKDPLFKWSFPEILNGQDVLNSILFEGIHENKERRESIIRAYLTEQFEIENEVKFKQIDLTNRLLNLFTDVPILVKKYNEKNKSLKNTLTSINHYKKIISSEYTFIVDEPVNIGAAEFLLHPKVQSEIERVLLEGGPGQGKSTISQYICQVHRVRLLSKSLDIALLPKNIKHTPVRLPIKIDLRDVASWVEKKNPYAAILTTEYFESKWKYSLESFLVGHIIFHSKNDEFTTTDFTAISKLSPLLFVFDGFDEIANIKVRGDVIEFINKGITRISANAKSIQVVITSRPAAFSDSIGFSIDNYPHFELADITSEIINEYVEKWIKAAKLESRDANELRKLIKEKLEMPHLKGLAKSPMQLAIFISLLRTKGQSLPNKRTSLYDSYIGLFFDRESEKNILIRDKRDLIIDIHQYIAWVLHSEAELHKNSGSISVADLISRLQEYLKSEGHETDIAEQLFDAMKERVCALVSRVQGTFEFEVQPLREYFCAKFLYKSAPHSSAGSVRQGSKPDRFNAILRNTYWQNVVRFFAGCADAGELDMIIHELKELQKDEILKHTNYPRIVTAQILSDYVFTQKPLKLRDVVKIIVEGINIGKVINQDGRFSSNEPLLLPNECGRTEVVEECFNQLILLPKNDYSSELIGIINNNPLNTLERWSIQSESFKGRNLTKWLEYAYRLQLIHKIEAAKLLSILSEDSSELKRRLHLVIKGNRVEIVDKSLEFKKIALYGILNYDMSLIYRKSQDHSFFFLSIVLHPFFYTNLSKINDTKVPLLHYLSEYGNMYSTMDNSRKLNEFTVLDEIDTKIKNFSISIENIYNIPLDEFKNNFELWDNLVEKARLVFTDCWSFNVIAAIAAGVKSKAILYDGYSDLHDASISLCKRTKYARMKSGQAKYWEKQLSYPTNLHFTLLVFFTWATPKVIVQLMPLLSKKVKSLSLEEFEMLANSLSGILDKTIFDNSQQVFIEREISMKRNQDELKFILSLRFEDANGQKFVYKNINKSTGVLERTIEVKFRYLIQSFLKNPVDASILNKVKLLYRDLNHTGDRYHYSNRGNEEVKIPYETAKLIMRDCKEYPRIISSLAEKSCRLYANEHLTPVGAIAKKEKWFG